MVRGLGIDELPAFAFIRVDGTVHALAQGWNSAEWRDVAHVDRDVDPLAGTRHPAGRRPGPLPGHPGPGLSAPTRPPLPDLPILEVVPALLDTLASGRHAVVSAPPGAGKSTVVPLALLGEAWLAPTDRIVMLEPRRLATRATARRMADLTGTAVGDLDRLPDP